MLNTEPLEYVNSQPPIALNSQTNVIISSYENKVSQNIAIKTIAAAKQGKTPDFTKEELLYLNKKASENDDTELNVITPAPTITLKKGKTELNIKNAATLVKKMEEKYPTGTSNSASQDNSEQFVGLSFPLVIGHSPVKDKQIKEDVDLSLSPLNPFSPTYISPTINTANKNAYEIRTDILGKALDWVQYKRALENNIGGEIPTEEDVLAVAQKFYKFVENKR